MLLVCSLDATHIDILDCFADGCDAQAGFMPIQTDFDQFHGTSQFSLRIDLDGIIADM